MGRRRAVPAGRTARARPARGRLDEGGRRRIRSRGRQAGERRRDAQRGRARRAGRLLLDRLRVRRPQGRAVRGERPAASARCVRADEARGRGRGSRRLDRPFVLALRFDRPQLRPDDASARRRARRGVGRGRPARLADLRRTSRGGDARAPEQAARRLPRGGRGRLHVGRLRGGDLRGGGAGLPGEPDHGGGVRPAGATAGLLGAAEREGRAALAPLARGAERLLWPGSSPGQALPSAAKRRQRQAVSSTGARSRSGSHHSRLAAYHSTVSRSPSSQPTSGSQPSSLRSFDESRR